MRRRRAARIILLDAAARVLLFRYVTPDGIKPVQHFWATPGGGVDPGESFAAAAIRELREETGIVIERVEAPIATLEFEMILLSGEPVLAEERYFLVRIDGAELCRSGWTEEEIATIVEHRWWSAAELSATQAVYYPADLADTVARYG